jgi:hypothetical protein
MPSIDPAVRGAALVAAVIERVEKGKSLLPLHQLRPVPAAALAALRLPNDAPLPPSLRMWLAYDASFFMRATRWFTRVEEPRVLAMPLPALVAQELRSTGQEFESLAASLLKAPCARLGGGGGDSFEFLYLGQPDPAGEYPVFVADIDDQPCVELALPGFDVWLACKAGLVPPDRAKSVYKLAMAEQAHLNLGGCLAQEDLNGWTGQKVKRPPAGSFPTPAEVAAPVLATKKRKGPLLPGEAPTTANAVLGLLEEAAELGEDERYRELAASARKLAVDGAAFADGMREAAVHGNVAFARCLLDLGVPVDHRDKSGSTALYVAALNGHLELARLLLERGADPNARCGDYGEAPLHIAANNVPQVVDQRAHAAVIRALCAAGASIEQENDYGTRALDLAASSTMAGSGAEVVLALLECGATVGGRDDRTGLLVGAIRGFGGRGGSASAVKALLAAGVDPNEVETAWVNRGSPSKRVPPLALAYESMRKSADNEAEAIARALIEAGADEARARRFG